MIASSLDDAGSNTTGFRSGRGPEAALMIVVGGALAFLVAPGALGLVRDTFHFNCSWGTSGDVGPEGAWVCADGIGYLGAAVALGGTSALLVVAGLLVAVARASRGRSIAFLLLAAISLACIGFWTLHAASYYSGPRPAGESGWELWAVNVMPALILSALGLVVGLIGAVTRRRWSRLAVWCGIGLVVVGTVLQLGVGIATLVSAGLLAAAGLPRPRRTG